MLVNKILGLAVKKPSLARFASTANKKGGFDPMSLVNILGLPGLAFIFFYILPISDTSKMHNTEYYAEEYRKNQKKIRAEREARQAAAAAAASSS